MSWKAEPPEDDTRMEKHFPHSTSIANGPANEKTGRWITSITRVISLLPAAHESGSYNILFLFLAEQENIRKEVLMGDETINTTNLPLSS